MSTSDRQRSVSGVLKQVAGGEEGAWGALVELLYPDLRRVAAARMRSEAAGQTLQPTELVHEVYLRLSGCTNKNWQSRAHFCAAASVVMRHILVDRARHRHSCGQRVPIMEVDDRDSGLAGSADLIDLDRALQDLAGIDERLSRIVEMRYFGGLTVEEAAEVLGISDKTVKRDWSLARAFLHGRIHPK